MERDKELIKKAIYYKGKIPYINLNENNKYLGWVSDFGFELPNGKRMKLDLREESDLFLLFVLASSWSKQGQWEDATYFTAHLKYEGLDNYKEWLDIENCYKFVGKCYMNIDKFVYRCRGYKPRNRIEYRKDYYPSVRVLAQRFESIKLMLKSSNGTGNWLDFINYMRTINGLGSENKKMRIKIFLILRELRCQGIFNNIPGELCCVVDTRVLRSANQIGIKFNETKSMEGLIDASKIIYNKFEDLYDIPLFALQDLEKFNRIH